MSDNNRENPLESVAALSINAMGYTDDVITIALVKYRQQNPDKESFSAEELMEIILNMEDKGELPQRIPQETNTASAVNSKEANPIEGASCGGCNRPERGILCWLCKRCERCTETFQMCAKCYSTLK